MICIQTDPNSWAGAESSHGRDREGYKTRSDLLHFRRNCGEEVEVHFKSEARARGENLMMWCRKGEARELRHPVESGERHNRSRHQQEAVPKPQKGWESTHHPRFQPVPAGKRPSPPPRGGCRSGRTVGKEPCSLPARSSSSAVAVSPLLWGFCKAELPRCYLFCKTLRIIAFIYKYTDRFCVRVRVRVCVIF